MDDVLAIILGGGRGTRLFPLTLKRSKPAVPIGGKYRLIDIPISNCLNANLRQIFVLTQFNSESLNKHIGQTYKFDIFSSGFVTVLAAEQTDQGGNWFQGTADAVRQSLRHMRRTAGRDLLILSGDQLYNMDYTDAQKIMGIGEILQGQQQQGLDAFRQNMLDRYNAPQDILNFLGSSMGLAAGVGGGATATRQPDPNAGNTAASLLGAGLGLLGTGANAIGNYLAQPQPQIQNWNSAPATYNTPYTNPFTYNY